MAIHTRPDFAKLCGITPRDLSKYIKRGKVILTGNKVDDKLAENIDFIENRKKLSEDIEIVVIPKKVSAKDAAKDAEKLKRSELHAELGTKQRQLEVNELEEKIELLRIKKQTQEGYLIPTELVKELFRQHYRKITISFQQGAENLILEISKKKS